MGVCRARRELDELVCNKCGIRWAYDEPTPETCENGREGVLARSPSLMQRSLDALDMADVIFAGQIGVKASTIRELCRTGDANVNWKQHMRVYERLHQMVDARIAALIAARSEISARLQKEKAL
jgi:hypothetical protein